MRHFAGVLVGIVLLPAFFALNWAANLVGAQLDGGQERWWLVLLLVVYAAVGALTGILLAWRSVSPTALLVGGVLLVAAEVMLALPVLAGLKLNFAALYDHPDITDGRLLVAVGVALIFGGFLPTRWHRPVAKVTEQEPGDDGAYAGTEVLPGTGSPEDEAPTRQISSEQYDENWGTGRNDYVDEPEQPYTSELPRHRTADTDYERPAGDAAYEPSGYQYQSDSWDYRDEYQPGQGYEQGPPTEQLPSRDASQPGYGDEPPTYLDPDENRPTNGARY